MLGGTQSQSDVSEKIKIFYPVENRSLGGGGGGDKRFHSPCTQFLDQYCTRPYTQFFFSKSELSTSLGARTHTHTQSVPAGKSSFWRTFLYKVSFSPLVPCALCLVPQPSQATVKLVACQEISLPKYSILYCFCSMRVANARTQPASTCLYTAV